MYHATDNKAKVKKKARDIQFGGLVNYSAPAAKKTEMRAAEGKGKHSPVTLEESEGCFNSLATAAVTGKDQIEGLVKSITLLTKTNAELSAVVKSQMG